MQQESAYDYDLFVSYAAADEAWVQGFLLRELGIPAERLITVEDFAIGAPMIAELERAIVSSRYTLLIFSPDYLADQYATFGEQLISDVVVLAEANRLLPIKLRPCTLPLRIHFRVVLDCTVEAAWAAAMTRLRELFTRPAPQPESIPCPYPGMLPFQADQAPCFYGREAEIDCMEQHLLQQNLLFVIGPSGSGKSSLVFAGLLPRLACSERFERGFWRVRTMRPGAEPTRRLVELLAGELTRQAELIAAALAEPPPAQRLLLVIDQFEELFTQAERDEQERFIQAMQTLRGAGHCALVVTMRADFYPSLMLSSLWELDRSQRLELAPLRGAALRTAIVQPAADVGVYLEPVLLNQLLNDAQNEPGVLPLVQETMRLLWASRQRNLLTLSAYERLGQEKCSGLAVALARKADATFANLPVAQQRIARRVFVDLVNIAEGCPDTRRQLPLDALRGPADDPADFDRALETLTTHRLLTRSGDDRTQFVDLSHDILITGWPRFQEWLAAGRVVELQTRQLKQAAAAWSRGDRDESFLLGGSRLAEAERLAADHVAELDQDVAPFLDACRQLEAIRLRARYVGQAAGGALGAALGYGVVFGLSFAIAELIETGAIDVPVLMVTTLSILPVGALVGFMIGLGLWLWRRQLQQRIVATGLIGALTGSLAYGLYRLLTEPPGPFDPRTLLVGALLGVGIGCGAGFDDRRRLWVMSLGGVCGAALALPFGLHGPALGVASALLIVAGLALGGLTALGFQATAVDERERIVI